MDAIIPIDTPDVNDAVLSEAFRLRSDSITKIVPIDMNDSRSADAIEPIVKTPPSTSNIFDVHRVYEAFSAALQDPSNPQSPIGTQDYINGYRELVKFFDQLGYVFKFVKDDVVQKLGILQDLVDKNNGETSHFHTIQNAIDYETANNLIKTNPENFARTLLRLHRALIFIEEFLRGLHERPASESTVTIATSAYDSTLYYHHGFLIRTTVKVRFRALPSRKQLDEVLFRGRKPEMIDQYETFIKTIKQIYDTVDRYYGEKNYLQLP